MPVAEPTSAGLDVSVVGVISVAAELTGHERHRDVAVDAADVVLHRVGEGALAVLQPVDVWYVDCTREQGLDLQRERERRAICNRNADIVLEAGGDQDRVLVRWEALRKQ